MNIAVDLDGTLAYYESFTTPFDIGEPIEPMLERVKNWIKQGHTISIFTARVSHPIDAEECRTAIENWCLKHVGIKLEVTCIKSYKFHEFYDDRAIQVEANTGKLIGYSTRQ